MNPIQLSPGLTAALAALETAITEYRWPCIGHTLREMRRAAVRAAGVDVLSYGEAGRRALTPSEESIIVECM